MYFYFLYYVDHKIKNLYIWSDNFSLSFYIDDGIPKDIVIDCLKEWKIKNYIIQDTLYIDSSKISGYNINVFIGISDSNYKFSFTEDSLFGKTIIRYDTITNEICFGIITLNKNSIKYIYQLRITILHELGHIFGERDSYNFPEDIMYYKYNYYKEHPSDHDLINLYLLYPFLFK